MDFDFDKAFEQVLLDRNNGVATQAHIDWINGESLRLNKAFFLKYGRPATAKLLRNLDKSSPVDRFGWVMATQRGWSSELIEFRKQFSDRQVAAKP